MTKGFITKEQALELLNTPSDIPHAQRVEIIMSLLDPEYGMSDEEKELTALRAVAEAAEKLEQHWKDEHAHFACGGEAILLEALMAWRELTAAKRQEE